LSTFHLSLIRNVAVGAARKEGCLELGGGRIDGWRGNGWSEKTDEGERKRIGLLRAGWVRWRGLEGGDKGAGFKGARG